jgi:hypothetical protein
MRCISREAKSAEVFNHIIRELMGQITEIRDESPVQLRFESLPTGDHLRRLQLTYKAI